MQVEQVMHFFLYKRVNQSQGKKKSVRPVATYRAEYWMLNKDMLNGWLLLKKKSFKKSVWGN